MMVSKLSFILCLSLMVTYSSATTRQADITTFPSTLREDVNSRIWGRYQCYKAGTNKWLQLDCTSFSSPESNRNFFLQPTCVHTYAPPATSWQSRCGSTFPSYAPQQNFMCWYENWGNTNNYNCQVKEVPACPSGYEPYGSNGQYRLKVYTTPKTQPAAKTACAADGSNVRLVVVKDGGMTAAIEQAVAATPGVTTNDELWSSLEFKSANNWEWIDGSKVVLSGTTATNGAYVNWDNGSSADGSPTGQTCMKLENKASRTWEDETCTDLEKYVCECVQ